MILFFLGTGLMPWFGRKIHNNLSTKKLQPKYIQ